MEALLNRFAPPLARRKSTQWSGPAQAGQLAGLLHAIGELNFIELIVLVEVRVARILVLGLDGQDRTPPHAAKECHPDALREPMEVENQRWPSMP